MNGFGWQDGIAAAVALGALAWLVMRRIRRGKKPTPFCDSCPGCEATSGKGPAAITIVGLDQILDSEEVRPRPDRI